MPKIPTFETQARPTAEVGGVKANIQMPFETSFTKFGSAIAEYYVKERDIASKSEADQLYINAQTEIFNAKKEAESKSNPEEGIKYFDEKLNGIVQNYSGKATNDYTKKYFQTNIAKERPNYATSILTKTRDNLVTARTDQTDTKIKSKIFDTINSGNDFSFSILSQEVLNDYKQLELEGLKGPIDTANFKEKLPMMIEKEMVNKAANDNAYAALISLDNSKNFTSIIGEDREKLKQELRIKAEFQNKAVTFATGVELINSKKKIAEAFKGSNNQRLGIDPFQLSNFYTGNQDYDNQIFNLNEKFVNNKINLDTDYISNDKIINKILNAEINNPFEKFILPGEKIAKSVTERVGDGSINLDDDDLFTKIFENAKDSNKTKQNKEFFIFINKIVPLIEGSSMAKVFDQNYNNRLSSFRQSMYSKFDEGLKKNISVNDLLSPASENYIAKDILSYAPTKSNLREALMSYATKRENETIAKPPIKLPNETIDQYLKRYRTWKSTQTK
jgi:hypothetical protein